MMTAAALIVSASQARAQQVSTDYDMDAPFSTYRTYAWVKGHEIDDPINHKRIVAAIDSQLAVKGLRQVAVTDNPDVLLAYHASFSRNVQVTGFSSGWGGYRFANRTTTARAEEITVGTLVVDVMQASSRTIVWRGTATKELDPRANAEKREKNINKAAEKLFKAYPPSSKG
jgi:hypothetical protein